MALPPVPTMKPRAESAIINGIMRLIAGKRCLSGIIGHKKTIHYAIDGCENHHDDGRKDKT